MPRLFTGLEIPGRDWPDISSLRGGLPGARWIDPETLSRHLALHRRYRWGRRERNRLAAVSDQSQAVRCRPAGLSSFGGKKPRAVVASVVPSRPLIELQAELERLMQRFGLDPEGRKFHAACDAGAAARRLQSGRRGLSVGARLFPDRVFTASRFVLFSSRASTGGGPYVVEDSYALSA